MLSNLTVVAFNQALSPSNLAFASSNQASGVSSGAADGACCMHVASGRYASPDQRLKAKILTDVLFSNSSAASAIHQKYARSIKRKRSPKATLVF